MQRRTDQTSLRELDRLGRAVLKLNSERFQSPELKAIGASHASVIRQMVKSARANPKEVEGVLKFLQTQKLALKQLVTTIDVELIGTGQYSLGDVPTNAIKAANKSDKNVGVVFPSLCALRDQGLVRKIIVAGRNRSTVTSAQAHVRAKLAEDYNTDTSAIWFPKGSKLDDRAYIKALDKTKPSAAIIVTPDSSHFEIAMECIKRKVHVLIVKPLVQTLREHEELFTRARESQVLVQAEYHKQFDPFFRAARQYIQTACQKGPGFTSFIGEMTQPLSQLQTFAWAGKGSDINYYLNSHFMYFLADALRGFARPSQVSATAAWVNAKALGLNTPDRITVNVEWQHMRENRPIPGRIGTATFTSSWVAVPGMVHSEQWFKCQVGDMQLDVNQAHRGMTVNENGQIRSVNPLFFNKFPHPVTGKLDLSGTYGFESISTFVKNVIALKRGEVELSSLQNPNSLLPTLANSFQVTAMLEAANHSWRNSGRPVKILYDQSNPYLMTAD